jgi:hypothetical protein
MAVSYDAQSSHRLDAAGTGPLSHNHTIGGGVTKGLVLVFISYRSGATETFTVTVGGVSATEIASTAANEVSLIGSVCFGVATGASTGVKAIDVSWTNSLAVCVGVVSFDGVDQATPYSNGTATTYAFAVSVASLAITGTAGGATVDGVCNRGTGDITGPNGTATQTFAQSASDGMRLEGSYELNGSHTHTWTTGGQRGTHAGVNVNADADTAITGLRPAICA